MHLNVSHRVPIAREVETDFIVPIIIDVLDDAAVSKETTDRDDANAERSEFVVGRLWAERWDLALSEECGYEPIHIADVSAVWQQVCETLMKGRKQFRSDLGIEGFVSEIVYLHELLLHPEIRDRVAVVDAMIRSLTGINSLVVMQYEQGESHHLEDREYRDLGFCKIARSNLLIKDSSLRYPFSDKHPAGKSVEVDATFEHEQWLLEHWEKLIIDHPAL
jgi:hypothetical protein